jgi:choline dehydrogenase-like flavoprotein
LEELGKMGFDACESIILPARRKNFSSLIRQSTGLRGNLRILLNATAAGWQGTSDGNGEPVVRKMAARVDGGGVDLVADTYVVAAGALETTRVLLEIQRQLERTGLHFPHERALGGYLSDHLSCPIARVPAEAKGAIVKLFGPRFESGCLRTVRMTEKTLAADEPSGFAHFVFSLDGPEFRLARAVLGGIQARKLPSFSVWDVARGVVGLARLAETRVLQSRLHIGSDADIQLQLDVEQLPSAANNLRLSDELDELGRNRLRVSWQVGSQDREAIRRSARRIVGAWNSNRGALPQLEGAKEEAELINPHDVYHPVGTCRLGSDRSAVVDGDLKAYGLGNVYTLSTAVLPTAGTANPTFSMLCLGKNLAAHLETQFRSGAVDSRAQREVEHWAANSTL